MAMQLAESSYMTSLFASCVRIQENGCGVCIGQGGSPVSKGISLRTFNRNFPKRSGTVDAEVHLVSPLVAAASALTGEITVPSGSVEFKHSPTILDTDSFIMPLPQAEAEQVEVIRGPNIMALPDFEALPGTLTGEVMLKLGDNISTDDIQPAGTFLPRAPTSRSTPCRPPSTR